MILEANPVHDHQPHGVVERALWTLGGMIRTHKLALEQSYSKELQADHMVVPWLIVHAVVTVSLFGTGSDGRAAHERFHGKPYRKVLVSHFRSVRVAPSVGQNTRQSEQAGREVPQWSVSRTEVGNQRDAIGMATGVVTASAIKRRTVPERFLRDVLIAVVVHHGHRRQEHREVVMKYQQQGITLQRAVARNHCQFSQR